MVRRLLILALVISSTTIGQDKYTKDGTIQGSAGFSYGMMRDDVRNVYLQGFIQYFPEENVSLRGDGYYFFNSISDLQPLEQNHQIYAGGAYHFNSKVIDPYLGFQPGIAMSQRSDSVLVAGDLVASNVTVNPLTSFVAGINYFGSKYFSIFAEARFTRGIHMSNGWPKYLDELRFSFGLAFQINAKSGRSSE